MARLRIGTRGSPLALWQARWVRARLEAMYENLRIDLVTIRTQGDRILDAPLSQIGDKGLFTREIERALLDNEIDLAVHSLKDLPTVLPDGLALGAVCEREDPSDVMIAKTARSLDTLPREAVIATGSLRRRAQLLHLRPDLRIVDIRGNVDTRLKKLAESDWEGMVMARAGLVRLGREEWIAFVLTGEQMLPAVSQGALGLEVRLKDKETLARVRRLNHAPTRTATTAERAFLRRLEGGCQIPVAALGKMDADRLTLDGLVASLDGRSYYRDRVEGPPANAEALGKKLAERLLAAGADKILESIRHG